MDWNELTDGEKQVIEDKGTERPFSGEYVNFYKPVFMSAESATTLSTHLIRQNSTPGAGGLHLMIISQVA